MLNPTGHPCNECPFRRKSLPGYVGEATVEQFLSTAHCGELPLPCHKEVDYTDENWQEQQDEVHQCSGHATYLTNVCKSPRNQEVQTLPQNHERIFSTPYEFLDHHDGDAVEFTGLLIGQSVPKELAKKIREKAKKAKRAAKTK